MQYLKICICMKRIRRYAFTESYSQILGSVIQRENGIGRDSKTVS